MDRQETQGRWGVDRRGETWSGTGMGRQDMAAQARCGWMRRGAMRIDQATQARHGWEGRDSTCEGQTALGNADVKRLGGARRDVQRTDGARHGNFS